MWPGVHPVPGSSPRVRGTLYFSAVGTSPAGIIPACAGNTSSSAGTLSYGEDHPRVCGEHYLRTLISSTSTGSSPRVRGTPSMRECGSVPAGIIPACAGNTLDLPSASCNAGDHPRVCGEHRRRQRQIGTHPGSSPRVRGTPYSWACSRIGVGIIPACAGNTADGVEAVLQSWDHPRVCGEHHCLSFSVVNGLGSSPRVRGTLPGASACLWSRGIIPACAGNTLEACWPRLSPWDHPRVCGEHRALKLTTGSPAGSSPRVRGTPQFMNEMIFNVGIIPACAGNTNTVHLTHCAYGDHPRVCGEHLANGIMGVLVRGSSPRVRGTRSVGPRLP